MRRIKWSTRLLRLGSGCTLFGLFQLFRVADLARVSVATQAEVTHLETRLKSPDQRIDSWDIADRLSNTVYKTVTFYTRTGEKIVWQPRFPTTSKGAATGFGEWTHVPEDHSMRILYDPDDPTNFRQAGFLHMWMPWIALTAGGLGLASFGAWLDRYLQDAAVPRAR